LGLGVAAFLGLYVLFDLIPSLPVAKQVRVKADLSLLKKKLADYRKRNGVYPGTPQWVQEIGLESSWAKDLWGSDYVYRYPGKRNPLDFDLFSAGPDRIPDTTDDDWGQ
jgi:hypothetical protein